MPIYELDGQAPEFPGEGEYWVAETATLIGRVRLKREASVWFGAVLRAATTNGSNWANARRSRTIQRCTPIQDSPW